ALAAAPACSHKSNDDGTTPTAARSLPPLVLKDDTPDLLLTWIDSKGEAHVEMRPADVPAEGRAMVRVVVSDRDDGTRELVYVADLTKKRDDGKIGRASCRERGEMSRVEG